MAGFLLRLLIAATALVVADFMLEGIYIAGVLHLLLAALVFGLVNSVIRPIAVMLTIPITIITLGLFLLIINTAMLGLSALLVSGFTIAGFWSAFFGALIISVFSGLASWMIGPQGTVEIYTVQAHSSNRGRARKA